MNQTPIHELRAHYRLRYPSTDRPTICFEGNEREVAEISEGGIRITFSGTCEYSKDQLFEGVVKFMDGETLSIEGTVLRIEENEFVIMLSKGISFNRMVKEQIQLRNKNPLFLR